MKTKIKATTIGSLHKDLYFDKSVSISFDTLRRDRNCEYKVFVQVEPPVIINVVDAIIREKDNFDLILAWHPRIIQECKNSILFPFGSCWINEGDRGVGFKNKLISIIASRKRSALGHRLRHEVIQKAQAPIDAYGPEYSPLPTSCHAKEGALKEYMFSIIIENSVVENYFTEKLVDCMACGTVPVYWGCNNINDYFDKRGIIYCETADEILKVLPTLNRDKYMKMLPYLQSNLEESLKYADFWGRVEGEIKRYNFSKK